ncbi:MAG: GDP-mannose 4,6-dehydratase [Anaerolineae bacterium]|nr:GDP-mannose 4,6-dehydratase [Anaerolineae bacterium]
MRVLITGATGFVGNHLRRHLLAATDWDIYGTAYPDAPADPAPSPRESLFLLDLRDAGDVKAKLAETEPDYIVHLAAQSHVPTAYSDPWATLQNNILGQLNLLEAAVDLGQQPRILIIGSGEEYGRADEDSLPLTEDHPLRPENPYSVSKVTQDVMGYQYFVSYGLPVVRVRPFNHVGPGQSPRFALPAFANQIAEIEAGQRDPVLRVGNLAPARDFTDVRDVVRAYRLVLASGQPGEVYNVASGHPQTIQSIVDQLRSLAAVDIAVEVDPERYRPADIPVIYGDASKLRADTGWLPQIAMEQTIRDVLAEWREQTRSQAL